MKDEIIRSIEEPIKINLLVLPSYTSLLFGLILLVILGAILTSLLPGSQIWGLPLIVGIFFLTLRDYLMWPQKEKRNAQLAPIDDGASSLQNVVDELASQENQLSPQLIATSQPGFGKAFGTFRRHFISINDEALQILAEDIQNPRTRPPVRAMLAHEVAHILNRDVQWAGLSRSLIRSMTTVMLLAIWISTVFVVLIFNIRLEITQPQFWEQVSPVPAISGYPIYEYMLSKNPELMSLLADPELEQEISFLFVSYFVNAYWPLAFVLAFITIFFWRKLLRIREFYAALRAASLLGDVKPIINAYSYARLLLYKQRHKQKPISWKEKRELRLRRIRQKVNRRYLPASLSTLLRYHPPAVEIRLTLQKNPLVALGRPWEIAAWTGFAMVLLQIALWGSLTITYLQQPGAHIPLLVAATVFSVWLTPHICQGISLNHLLKMIIKMVVIFSAIKLSINVLDGLFLIVTALAGNLDIVAYRIDFWLNTIFGIPENGIIRFVGQEVSWPQIVDWGILRPILYFMFFGLPVLLITLGLDSWLKQRALTWYQLGHRVRVVFWSITGTLVLGLFFIVIPLGNQIFFSYIYSWSWHVVISILGGLLLLGLLTSFFLYFHRRWADKCPSCHKDTTSGYYLGKRCDHCDRELHSWLIAPFH